MTKTLLLAYLDPVSGGFIIYVIVGIFASAWVVMKKWGRKLKALATGTPLADEGEPDEAPEAPAADEPAPEVEETQPQE